MLFAVVLGSRPVKVTEWVTTPAEAPVLGSVSGWVGKSEVFSLVLPYSTWVLAGSLVVQVITAVVRLAVAVTFEITGFVVSTVEVVPPVADLKKASN